ncbi:unnamed protein product [Cylicocyclus nassatus]|uniref:SH3 domain-containing protein n=1 Tax=Cylicocyclus nassatus TaxID=53992 RepID=A0AA36H5U8_CYLNA|nr:unnamed protein product [Cylicocyclus nassatus]
MRRGIDAYQKPPPSGGYYYSRIGAGPPSSAPSPSSSHRHSSQIPIAYHDMQNNAPQRAGMGPRIDEVTPSYFVEHLATFAVGRQFGLTFPADGIRKLKQMEKSSAIWAQPLVLRFRQNGVTVEDENGDLVEQFPLDLIEQPTAHVSNDPRDTYNNILLFIVREDTRNKRSSTPTEMHIFQCNRVAATEVADDLQWYMRGQFRKVRPGRRNSGPQAVNVPPEFAQYPTDDLSVQGDTAEVFERDVNTLNRCFDDIERFVARIQSAALAQRELEQQAHRYRTANRRDKRGGPPPPDPNGILHMRAQLPIEPEFVDIFRKFKLSFNLLAKLKNHIHEPNAPELLHFLFTPLTVILEACHWGLGRNIAPQIVSPLLSLEARELMQNCLTSKETDVWMSLGETWRTPPEDWAGPLPAPYKPVFIDGFAPYGPPEQLRPPPGPGNYAPAPLHRGESAPPVHYKPHPRDRSVDTAPSTPMNSRTKLRPQRNMSVDNLDLDRLSLERERLDFERQKMLERERRLADEENKIKAERARLEAERKMIKQESDSVNSSRSKSIYEPPSSQPSPMAGRGLRPVLIPDLGDQSPRQRAFVEDAIGRGSKLVMATFDRVAQNAKELTVSRGEYLEVLDDAKNWWECRNVHQRVGYVPHTILSVVPLDQPDMRDTYMAMRDQQSIPNGHVQGSSSKQEEPTYEPAVPTKTYEAGVQANVQLVSGPYAPSDSRATTRTEMRSETFNRPASAAETISQGSVEDYMPQEPENAVQRKPRIAVARRTPETEAVVSELLETVGKTQGRVIKKKEQPPCTVFLNENSTPGDVSTWLQEKGFSMRVIELLEGQDGANLFALNKSSLMKACGKEEGSRLYSQLLVQKKQSNYKTYTNAELNAILNYRRKHVDVTNEAPGNEPATVAD